MSGFYKEIFLCYCGQQIFSHEHIFDETTQTGYFETKLKTLRRILPVTQRAYKPRTRSPSDDASWTDCSNSSTISDAISENTTFDEPDKAV